MKIILIIFLSFIFFINAYPTPVFVSGGIENDIRGRMCRLHDNSLLSVIVRAPNWNDGDLYYTRSIDNGLGWSALSPLLIENGDQTTHCILQTSDDTIRVFYASNETGDYKIYEVVSGDSDVVWIKRGRINLGWTAANTVYDPVVIEEEDGSLTMVYVNYTGGTGSVYISNCPFGGSWDNLKTLINSPSTYRPGICKHPNGTYMAAYHRKTGSYYYQNDVFIRTSTDRINWSSEVQLTTNMNSHDAFVNITSDSAYMVYYAKNQSSIYNLARRRSYSGLTWENEEQITNYSTNQTKPCFFIESNLIYQIWTYAVNYDTNNDIYFEQLSYLPNSVEEELPINNSEDMNININYNENILSLEIFLREHRNITIELYNISGQKVLSDQIYINEIIRRQYDLSDLSSACYFLKVINGDNYFCKKIFLLK